MAGHGGDVIRELETDHRGIEELFARVLKNTGERRRSLLAEAAAELLRHAAAEEAHLHPALRAHVPDGDAIADREAADRARVRRLLREIEGRRAGDPGLAGLANILVTEVAAHIRDVERTLLPALRAACTRAELDELGVRVRRSRSAAPAPPAAGRPPAPDIGPIGRVGDRGDPKWAGSVDSASARPAAD
ncbi:hemerythrin domain-containing protein [Kitasatospora sp. NPDC085879]|uniref:hemerythrin domain-containing protein n=1 Tax=Kitasatospora sp. NPDC085879 TaxID=3154769 RepID=UPI0034200F3F